MTNNSRKLCLGLLLWMIGTSALAQTGSNAEQGSNAERRFALPDHGYFVIQVPRDWKGQVHQPPNRLPPTITLGPGAGKPFEVLMTPIWPATTDRSPQSREQIRASVEKAAQDAKAEAVEREIPVVEFQGRSGPGFYFSATDRAPKPGEYKFLTQGILRVRDLTVTFAILTNDAQQSVVKQALDSLKTEVQDGV